jgi:RHS repeat-associated protein
MTSFNLPASITYNHVALGQGANAGTTPAASSTAAFTYGPEHQRAKQTVTTNSGNPWVSERTITYAGAMEKETLPANSSNGTAALNPGSTRIKTYLPRNLGYLEELLPSANNPSANATPEQFTVAQADYTHTDHLGSISAITDQAGTLIERLSYDTFGLRRNADGSDDASQTLIGQQDRHGYTGHEHLDAVALIHMNGRLYDPQLGRFTSADPSIPDPDNPQNLNRYSYVLNNPLNATDPSGFSQLYIKVTLPYIDGPMWGGVILDAGTIGGLMGGWGLTGQTTTAEDEQKKIEEKNRERDQRESRCNRGGWSCVGDSGSSNYLTPEEQKAEAQKWLAGLESSKKNLEFAFGRKCQGDECVRNVLVALSMLPEVGTVFALTLAIWDKSWEEAALAVLPIRVPKVAGAAKEAGVVANGIRGRASEARVLNELGLTKNTTAVSTAEGRSIPDALTKSLSVEVKDAAKVSLTRQLRIQTEAARASGRESVLITGENTCVSGACSRAFDTIVRRPDLGPR